MRSNCMQLLKKLQRSIATLHTCGEWGEAPRDGRSAESSLELQTECIWMEARAPQKQLFDLTVSPDSPSLLHFAQLPRPFCEPRSIIFCYQQWAMSIENPLSNPPQQRRG